MKTKGLHITELDYRLLQCFKHHKKLGQYCLDHDKVEAIFTKLFCSRVKGALLQQRLATLQSSGLVSLFGSSDVWKLSSYGEILYHYSFLGYGCESERVHGKKLESQVLYLSAALSA